MIQEVAIIESGNERGGDSRVQDLGVKGNIVRLFTSAHSTEIKFLSIKENRGYVKI